MGEAKIKERARATLVAEVNQAELACRIFECMAGIQRGLRPYPTSPEKSMNVIKQEDPVIFLRVVAATEAVMAYLGECLNAGQVPS